MERRTEKVTGILKNGHYAEMQFTRVQQDKRIVWQQRALTKTASHLNRDYLCIGDTFESIMRKWFPCDWKTYTIEKKDTEAWGDQ